MSEIRRLIFIVVLAFSVSCCAEEEEGFDIELAKVLGLKEIEKSLRSTDISEYDIHTGQDDLSVYWYRNERFALRQRADRPNIWWITVDDESAVTVILFENGNSRYAVEGASMVGIDHLEQHTIIHVSAPGSVSDFETVMVSGDGLKLVSPAVQAALHAQAMGYEAVFDSLAEQLLEEAAGRRKEPSDLSVGDGE